MYRIGISDFTRREVLEAAHKLVNTNLQGLDLCRSNLQQADLREVNLRYARLREADLSEAKYSHSTVFPKDFDPEEAGMVLVE